MIKLKIVLNENAYELIDNYKDAFNKEEINNLYTDYFKDYDYILGDYAYSKLRLKGFCNKDNKMLNSINDYENINNYIKEQCAYDCKYFVLKKIEK